MTGEKLKLSNIEKVLAAVIITGTTVPLVTDNEIYSAVSMGFATLSALGLMVSATYKMFSPSKTDDYQQS